MIQAEERRDSYRLVVAKAADWLAEQQGPDGSFGLRQAGIGPFMVTPLALLLGGKPGAALATLKHIKSDLFLGNGRLRLLEGGEGSTPVCQYAYQPSWVVISAQLNGCFDLSFPIARHLLSFQEPRSGGMFGRIADRDRQCGTIDLPSTGMAGLAFLHTGYLAEARRVGDYLLSLLAMQPRLPERFYTTYDTATGLQTDVDESSLPANRNFPLVLGRGVTCSSGWLLGLLIACLSDLYRATGEEDYLRGAVRLFDFALTSPDIGAAATAHKHAWGCAKLYLASHDPRHREVGCRVADYLASIQQPDGSWLYHGIFRSLAEQGRPATVNITSQFCAWVAMVLSELEV